MCFFSSPLELKPKQTNVFLWSCSSEQRLPFRETKKNPPNHWINTIITSELQLCSCLNLLDQILTKAFWHNCLNTEHFYWCCPLNRLRGDRIQVMGLLNQDTKKKVTVFQYMFTKIVRIQIWGHSKVAESNQVTLLILRYLDMFNLSVISNCVVLHS